jgi:hypothetical protein
MAGDQDASGWADVLADVPLFGGLNRRQLKKVAGVAQVARYNDGAPIARAGEPS